MTLELIYKELDKIQQYINSLTPKYFPSLSLLCISLHSFDKNNFFTIEIYTTSTQKTHVLYSRVKLLDSDSERQQRIIYELGVISINLPLDEKEILAKYISDLFLIFNRFLTIKSVIIEA